MEGKIWVIFMSHKLWLIIILKIILGGASARYIVKDKIGEKEMVSQNKRAMYQERSDKNGKPQ